MMYDARWIPIATRGGRLAVSALPDAPIVPDRPGREHRRLRELAGRLAAVRPRLRATHLEKEEPCGI